jgi:hypothetical protein
MAILALPASAGAPLVPGLGVRRPRWGPRTVVVLAVAGVVAGAGVSIVRLLGDDYQAIGHYNKILNPVLVLLAFMSLAVGARQRVDPFLAVSGVMIPMGVVIGLLHGGDLRYFVSHLFVGLFIAVLYAAAYNTRWDPTWLADWTGRVSAVMTGAFAASLAVFWGIVLVAGRPLYLGVGTAALLLPFAYYLTRRRWLSVLLVALLILVSGRRGTWLGMLMIVVAFFPVASARGLALRLGGGFVLFALVVVGSFLLEPYLDVASLPAPLDSLVAKWYLLNFLSEDFEVGRGSSGRSAEIEYAFRQFATSPWHWMSGMGYGWSYFNAAEIKGIETRNFYSHYVHVSPLNIVLLHGIPTAGLFFWVLWRRLERIHRWSVTVGGRGSVEFALVLFLVGSFVVGLTGYNYAIDPLLWLVLGILASSADERTVAERPGAPPAGGPVKACA